MAKIHTDDLLVLNRPVYDVDGEGERYLASYEIRSYTGEDYNSSVQQVIDDNHLDDRYVLMSGDTMNGLLIVDLGISDFDEQDPLSVQVYGRVQQTQNVISPLAISDDQEHSSLIFATSDPNGTKRRNHAVLTDTILTFKSYDGDLDDIGDTKEIITLTGDFVYIPKELRMGPDVGTPEVMVFEDGSSYFKSIKVTDTDPANLTHDNLVYKSYVDTYIEQVQTDLTELVTVDKTSTYVWQNGNIPVYTDEDENGGISASYVGSVLTVRVPEGNETFEYVYIHGNEYVVSGGSGTNLKVRLAVEPAGDTSSTITGVKVIEGGSGYQIDDELTLTEGSLPLEIVYLAKGTKEGNNFDTCVVSEDQFKWQLDASETSETWNGIRRFYFNPSNSLGFFHGDVTVNSFPVGYHLEFTLDEYNLVNYDGEDLVGNYMAKYEIQGARIGPSFAVTGFSIDDELDLGMGYSPSLDVETSTVSGNGSGMTVDILRTDPTTGAILKKIDDFGIETDEWAIEINQPGSGYAVNDRIAVDGGISSIILTVASIQDTISEDEEGLVIVEVLYIDDKFELQQESDVEDVPLEVPNPGPENGKNYNITTKLEIPTRTPSDGIFNWFFKTGFDEEWEYIERFEFSVLDSASNNVGLFAFPEGAIISIASAENEDNIYATYRVTSATDKTVSIIDPVTNVQVTYEYVDVNVDFVTLEIISVPEELVNSNATFFIDVDSPLKEETAIQIVRVEQKIDKNSSDIASMRTQIELLENSVSSGKLIYQSPLDGANGVPEAARFYIKKNDGNPSNDISEVENHSVVLSNVDVESVNKDWAAGMEIDESLLVAMDATNGLEITYLIKDIIVEGGLDPNGDDYLNPEERDYTEFVIELVTRTPGTDLTFSNEPVVWKTRKLSDGVTEEEANKTYLNKTSNDTVKANFGISTVGDERVLLVDQLESVFFMGRGDKGPTVDITTPAEDPFVIRKNDGVRVRIFDQLFEVNGDIELNAGQVASGTIKGVDTPLLGDSVRDHASSQGFVIDYVQDYVDGIVGAVTIASKDKAGPVKLDALGFVTTDEDSRMLFQKADTSVPGIARFNGTHFNISKGDDMNRVDAHVLKQGGANTDVGMVKVKRSRLFIGSDDQLDVYESTDSQPGVVKLRDSTSNTAPSWSNYDGAAASCRAVYHAHKRADDAYEKRFIPGMALHATSTSEVKLGGIYKSGTAFYMRVS